MYAHITLNSDFPPRPRPGVLHLCDLRYGGPDAAEQTDVSSATDFAVFVAAHPEIGTVTVADSRFPQRPVPWAQFIAKYAGIIWPEAELLAAFREVRRRQVASPGHVPSLAAALQHPEAFVEGMTEG